MSPTFTAECALQPARRSYRTIGPGARAKGVTAAQGASGVYVGTYCLGNVLTVIVVDIDDNGQVVNWHPVDEIGSC
jgi:hypothetical protein